MLKKFSTTVFFILLVISCARQGTPSGGPKDETPPKYLSSNPDTLSLNVPVDLTEIKINFDEYLILKDHQTQLVVSPPFEKSANYLPVGTAAKTIRIKLNEPLKENTTYNFNFGSAVQDHNEGNILKDFQFVFSTGDYIDSLEISGKATVPSLRKQPKDLVIGLFKIDSAYSDSIVMKQKPFYLARPDAEGNFKLNYLHSGEYQMIAFNDEVQNLQFDLEKEKIGFVDGSVLLDSNQKINIELFDQLPDYKVVRGEQKAYGHLAFKFKGQPEEVEVRPLDFDFTTSEQSYSSRSDSLNFWFNPGIDSIAENSKRLKFEVKHKGQSDTVSIVYSNSHKHNLKLESKSKLGLSPARKLKMTSNYPIVKFDSTLIKVKKDSLVFDVSLIQNQKNKNEFMIDFPVELSSKYDVEFYPGAVTDIFGKVNDSMKYSFSTRARNDYGNLILNLRNVPEHPFFIELYNDKDELLETEYTTSAEFFYNYLTPGNYYFRILVDVNENLFWDTGDFFSRTHPEPALIYPAVINVRAMWDTEETWMLPFVSETDTKKESSAVLEEDSD